MAKDVIFQEAPPARTEKPSFKEEQDLLPLIDLGLHIKLSANDIVEKGDEFWHNESQKWIKSTNAGHTTDTTKTYRRLRVPYQKTVSSVEFYKEYIDKTMYKILGSNELIEKGDEFFYPPDKTWNRAELIGEYPRIQMYRRKKMKDG